MVLSERANLTPEISLLAAARATTLPFEMSPTGRWVRFEGDGIAVYVVCDAWAAGCLLLTFSGEDRARRVKRFLRSRDAVAAAVKIIRRRAEAPLAEKVSMARY